MCWTEPRSRRRNLAARRIGIALLLANIGGNPRTERAAKQGIGHAQRNCVWTACIGYRQPNDNCRLRCVRTIGYIQDMLRRYFRHVADCRRALGPTPKACRNRFLQLRGIESSRYIQVRSRRAEVAFVIFLDIRKRRLVDALLRRENRSVRMIQI